LHYQTGSPFQLLDLRDVDLSAALVGFIFGAVSGLIISSLQWLILRSWTPRARLWIPLNILGFGLVHTLNDAVTYLPLPLPLLLVIGGILVGIPQAIAFRQVLPKAIYWIPLAALTWFLAFQTLFAMQAFVAGNPLAEVLLGHGSAGLITGAAIGLALKFMPFGRAPVLNFHPR
jgi:hypothetical protein